MLALDPENLVTIGQKLTKLSKKFNGFFKLTLYRPICSSYVFLAYLLDKKIWFLSCEPMVYDGVLFMGL